MSPDVPRRPRPGQEQRQAGILQTHAALSGRGAALSARPVRPTKQQQRYQPPVDALGVVATGQFIASNLGSGPGAVPWGAEFSGITGDGSNPTLNSLFDIVPISPSQTAVDILESGWYSMSAYAVLGDVGPGDVATIEATQFEAMRCLGNAAYIGPGSGLVVQCSSTPFFVYALDLPLRVLLVVSATAGYVSQASLFITRYDGADVN